VPSIGLGILNIPLFYDRILLLLIIGPLWFWTGERRVLRDAEACSAQSISVNERRVSFAFVDRSGTSYGGEGLYFGLVRPPVLAALVLYAVKKPEMNKIGMNLLFHRLVIIGRGLTDLDKQTVDAHHPLPQPVS
jgi:hypothetical protein